MYTNIFEIPSHIGRMNCFHGEMWATCPHCESENELGGKDTVNDLKIDYCGYRVVKCNHCGKLFKYY